MNRAEQEQAYREAMAARRSGERCPLCGYHHGALSQCAPAGATPVDDPPTHWQDATSEPREPPAPPFGGRTYDPAADGQRLKGQLARVLDVMKDGEWRTLRQIADATGDPEASVSARLRDFRKQPFGGHELDSERLAPIGIRTRGTWRYRLRLQLRDDA